MNSWPENKNPIITVFRENFDSGDRWGSTVNFLFALCDIAITYDVTIPPELQFAQSPFGADTDAYSYRALEELLEDGAYVYDALTVEEFRKHVEHALKVLGRYDAILRLEGHSY